MRGELQMACTLFRRRMYRKREERERGCRGFVGTAGRDVEESVDNQRETLRVKEAEKINKLFTQEEATKIRKAVRNTDKRRNTQLW